MHSTHSNENDLTDTQSGWKNSSASVFFAVQEKDSLSSSRERSSVFTYVPDLDSRDSVKKANMAVLDDVFSRATNIVSAVRVLPSERYLIRNASFFVLKSKVVNHFRFKWKIQSPCPPNGPSLLVVVPSAPGHRVQRTAIRQTWASHAYNRAASGQLKNDTIKVVFFLGMTTPDLNQSAILSESRKFEDIMVGDFVDSYRKTQSENGAGLAVGSRALRRGRFSSFALGRSRSVRPPPTVSRVGKWAVSRQAYPLPHWPQYLYGHSYVISGNAITSLRHASHHLPLIVNEDAYVTGVLAKSSGVARLHSDQFALLNYGYDNRCDLVSGADVSQTGFPFLALYSLWQALQSGNCSDIYLPTVIFLDSHSD
ncbi:hypothetical protein ACOMHN_014961 [Nucella lapillus]